jgi:pre-mRNA cleavage complex 2 protein Pcf11
MLAYSQVDGTVRRKLEEMLKTWREPVPGSLSTTPVFPIASTQTIVDSLNKFRVATSGPNRHQSTPLQGQPARVASVQPYRQTPTPPQSVPQFLPGLEAQLRSPQPQVAGPIAHYSQPPVIASPYAQSYQQSTPAPYFQHPQPSHTPQFSSSTPQPPTARSSVDLKKLHADIDDLTTDAKIECATHPLDANAQRKLASLQTLKEILDSGQGSESDLLDIQNTIMQKMAEKMVINRPTPLPPATAAYVPPQPPAHQPQPPIAAPSSIFNSTNLAELLRVTASHQQAVPPPGYYPPAQSGVATPTFNAPAAPPAPENPLIAQLRASGLLTANSTPPQGLTPPLQNVSMFGTDASVEIKLTSASIRIARPQKVAAFLTARPNQCSTCGRRFMLDSAGSEKKARHLDWHFKTKARMLEAEKRGQNRSWYVDEREWIASKEYDDDGGPADGTETAAVANKKKLPDFVRAPTDAVLRSLPCPIDQEPFKSEWSEEVQDFIWKDAVQVGNRIYHLSCYTEVTKSRNTDGASTPVGGIGRTATPDSVLGKRKAEEDPGSSTKSRVKLEPPPV